jgi:hypothetical protein
MEPENSLLVNTFATQSTIELRLLNSVSISTFSWQRICDKGIAVIQCSQCVFWAWSVPKIYRGRRRSFAVSRRRRSRMKRGLGGQDWLRVVIIDCNCKEVPIKQSSNLEPIITSHADPSYVTIFYRSLLHITYLFLLAGVIQCCDMCLCVGAPMARNQLSWVNVTATHDTIRGTTGHMSA